MTDTDLIRWIQARSVEEWAPAELAVLQARLPDNPVLRQALFDRWTQEGRWAGTSADIELTLAQMFEQAQRKQSLLRRRKLIRSFVLLGFVLLLAGLGFWLQPGKPEHFVADLESRDIKKPEPGPSPQMEVDHGEPADALTVVTKLTVSDGIKTEPLTPQIGSSPIETVLPESDEPWTQAYSANAPLEKPDSERLLVDFATAGHDEFPEAEARRWWTSFEGQPFQWGLDVIAGRRMACFQGISRLRLPWRDDTLLRMTLLDSASCEIFFWRGTEGVSLRYYTSQEPHVWAAYRVRRTGLQTNIAERLSMLTTDNGAFFRSNPGTFDLQIQHNTLVLARGGIPLLTVPCGGLPEQVLLEGNCRFRGMTVHRSEPISLPDTTPHPVVFGGEHGLAKLDWKPVADFSPLTVDRLADGRVKFTTNPSETAARVFTRLPRPGLFEVIFRIDEAEEGTGLSLCDSLGKPLASLAILRDPKSRQLTINAQPPTGYRDAVEFDVTQSPVPYFAPGQWVKLIAGLGSMQVWTSGDRLHWGHVAQIPIADGSGYVSGVGVIGYPDATPRAITLGHLEVRELSGLVAQTDAALIGQVPDFTPEEFRDGTLWMHHVLQSQPAGVETDRWLSMCAVQTLSRSPQKEFGFWLWKRLLDGIAGPDAEPQHAIAALHDALLLIDQRDDRHVVSIFERMQAIGLKQLEQGAARTTRSMRTALMRMPVWTNTSARPLFDRLAYLEIVSAVVQNDWISATGCARECQFWMIPAMPGTPLPESAQTLERLAIWVRGMAAEQQPGLAQTEPPLPFSWRHPLILPLNKEAYNLHAELDAALHAHAYDDACGLVTSLRPADVEGLLSDLHDRELSVSLPTAVQTALHDHPEFAAAMNRDYGQAGLLRVRKAVAEGEIEVIRMATVQFLGTPAAAEAHQWLGDRDLSAGSFADAEVHYGFALDSASADQRKALHPRLQLAARWNGKSPLTEFDEFPETGLTLNDYQLSAAEFSSLLADSKVGTIPAETAAKVAVSPILPASYKLELKGQVDGNPGNNPGRAEYRTGDPFGKQIAWAVDDQQVYLSNRFQINAYDLETAQVTWAQSVGSEQGEAYEFPFQPMKPLILEETVFVRRITRAGVELCCLKKSDGTIIWRQRPMTHVLTDPVFWQGNLCALIGGKVDDDQLQVALARFDRQSGSILSTQPVVRFRDIWNQAIPCNWQLTDRWALCQIGNVTVCVSPDRNVRWLRRPTWLPLPVDDLIADFRSSEPIIRGERVFLAIPGTRTLDCLDLASGRLDWRRPLPEIRGIRGASETRIVVDLGDRLQGIDPESGDICWTAHLPGLLEAWSIHDHKIICAERGRGLTPAQRPNLIWLDATTGKELAQTPLETAEKEEWQLGPFIPVGDSWWVLGGSGWKDHKRDLWKLQKN